MARSFSGPTAFCYKAGGSPLHRMPAAAKVIFVPILNIALFALPLPFCLSAIAIQAALAFALKFTIREQLCDLAPALFYGIFIYSAQLLSQLHAGKFFFDPEPLFFLARLSAAVQCASLLFKTSTPLQIREGIARLLPFCPALSSALAMFALFVPQVFKIYAQARRAWTARGGSFGLRMIFSITPAIFSAGMKFAADAQKAIRARKGA